MTHTMRPLTADEINAVAGGGGPSISGNTFTGNMIWNPQTNTASSNGSVAQANTSFNFMGVIWDGNVNVFSPLSSFSNT